MRKDGRYGSRAVVHCELYGINLNSIFNRG